MVGDTMDPTIFFLFFLAGFLSIALGMFTKNPGFIFIGGAVCLLLYFPLQIDGFTVQQVANRTISYTYYPLYGEGSNQSINMTNTSTVSYSYSNFVEKDSYTNFLGIMLIGLGLIGMFGAYYYYKSHSASD